MTVELQGPAPRTDAGRTAAFPPLRRLLSRGIPICHAAVRDWLQAAAHRWLPLFPPLPEQGGCGSLVTKEKQMFARRGGRTVPGNGD